MSNEFPCHGQTFKSRVLDSRIEEDGGINFWVIDHELFAEKDGDPEAKIDKDTTWTPLKEPVKKTSVEWLTKKALTGKKLPILFKTFGFSGTPIDLLDPDYPFDPVGRVVVAKCDPLPPDYDPASPLPEERWFFPFAQSSGKRKTVSPEARRALVAKLRAEANKPEFEPETDGDDEPDVPAAPDQPVDSPDIPF